MTQEITLTTGMVTIVDDEDYPYLSQFKWFKHRENRHVYVEKSIIVDGIWKSLKMHREIMNAPPGVMVDHIDGNSLNNTRANLRLCTLTENSWNQGLSTRNTSSFKGVSQMKGRRKCWCTSITVNGKRVWLGAFYSKEDAARAYNRAAIELYGPFARLNKVRDAAGLTDNVLAT